MLQEDKMKAVLFDMDGILIDTEKYLTVYKQKAMREAGYRLDLETAYKFRSCASVFAREQMKGIFGEDFPYDELRRRRQELMSDHIARFGIEKKPYVEETIKELKRRGYQTAVVTATAEDRAVRYLEMVGFKELFDEIISASMVKLGKPRPDVYLYACEKIGRKPEECMAVEDSPNGVNAAYQAGCHVTMVPDLTPADEEVKKMADHVVPDLRGLLDNNIYSNAHNEWLTLLVQQGILGVIAYGGIFLTAFRNLRISATRDPRALAVFLGLTGYLICSLFTFQHVLSTPFAFALLGMAEGVLCKVILIKF